HFFPSSTSSLLPLLPFFHFFPSSTSSLLPLLPFFHFFPSSTSSLLPLLPFFHFFPSSTPLRAVLATSHDRGCDCDCERDCSCGHDHGSWLCGRRKSGRLASGNKPAIANPLSTSTSMSADLRAAAVSCQKAKGCRRKDPRCRGERGAQGPSRDALQLRGHAKNAIGKTSKLRGKWLMKTIPRDPSFSDARGHPLAQPTLRSKRNFSVLRDGKRSVLRDGKLSSPSGQQTLQSFGTVNSPVLRDGKRFSPSGRQLFVLRDTLNFAQRRG